MKRLTIVTALILSICTIACKIIGRHEFAICCAGGIAWGWFCLYWYSGYVDRKVKEETAAMKKRDITHMVETKRYYHEGIEQIAHICVN